MMKRACRSLSGGHSICCSRSKFQFQVARSSPSTFLTSKGLRGTLGVWMEGRDVFVEGVGKAGIPECK